MVSVGPRIRRRAATRWIPPSRTNPPWYSGVLLHAVSVRHVILLSPCFVGGILTVILEILLNQDVIVNAEGLDCAQLAHLIGGFNKLFEVAIVFRNCPYDLGSIDVIMIPLQELLGRGNVLGDGLFRENVLPSQECLFDEFRLDEDGKAF